MNLALHMVRAGQVFANRPAIARDAVVLYDYAGLAGRVAALAGAMAGRLGVQPGDRIMLAAANCVEYLEIIFAAWHAGAVIVPVNAKSHPRELAFMAADCTVRHCFASPALAAALAGEGAAFPVTAIGTDDYAALIAVEAIEPVERAAADPAWIFYTSGTTGKPKGAVLSHRNLLAMTHCHLCDVDPQGPWRALLHPAPMSHGSGLIALAYVVQGGCHVVPGSGGFDEDEVFAMIDAWPGCAFFAAPTMVKRLVECGNPSAAENLKVIVYGGGPMFPVDCLAAMNRFGGRVAQLYGQGESPMTITALTAADHARARELGRDDWLTSVGYAQSGVEVRILDEAGQRLPPGAVGEVAVRGDTVMLGYWNDPEASARTLVDGWLRTGDCGSICEQGYLTLKDRSKDLIISGGSNIYPREVEEVLLQHPGVAEAAVIGRPDPEWGESVVAYVVAVAGAALDQAGLDQLCMAHIARFKRPREYRFVTDLPKNSYGKVLKKALRESEAEHDGQS